MAAINDLISQIQDETLRNRIQEEVSKMAKQKKFGLVFEEHMPESTPLYDMPIKSGCNVMRRDSKDDKSIYVVLKVEDDTAVCVKPEQKDETVTFELKDIVRVAEFGEPIYPYLKPLDSVCNAPDSDLWHTLIEADNYHALQLLEYLYAGKVDCIYIDPPYNTGAKDWKYNNDYVDGNDTYRHSKWLSFMERRLKLAKKLLNPADSVLIVTIDEKEYGDASFEGDADYTAGEDDDNEPVFTNRFKTPSSIGISFYLESSTKSFNVDVTWGDYTKASDKTTNKEGKKVDVSTYTRHPQKETVVIDLQEFSKNKEYPLVCDSNVILYISKIGLKQGYTLVTAYVINKRKNPESDIAGMMFQVNLRAYSQDKMDIFVAEHICRKILAVDEFYFAQRPILGRGRGCAATWKANKNGRASEIVSTFIPEYEFPGVSAALEGFDPFFFSMRTLSVAKKKDDIINRLNVLADSYD